jgi:hypothetical protein
MTGRIQEGALSPKKTPTQPPAPTKLVTIATVVTTSDKKKPDKP